MTMRCAELAYMARNLAGFTRERAAELIDVAPRTLAYYEGGRSIPDDIIAAMVRAYKNPALGYHWLINELRTGRTLLPKVEAGGVSSTALRLRVVMQRAEQVEGELERICYDDRLTADEHQTLDSCTGAIMELAAACIGVALLNAKCPAPEATGAGQQPKNKTR